MIAKVIVHARTRELAIARMKRALEAMVIEGIKTTIPLHLKIMDDPRVSGGRYLARISWSIFWRKTGRRRRASKIGSGFVTCIVPVRLPFASCGCL